MYNTYFILGATIALVLTIIVTLDVIAIRRYMFRKWLKRAKVQDIISHPLYEANMRCTIDDLNNQRAKDAAKAAEQKGRLKAHPVEHLIDEGVFNGKDMTFLYLNQINKTLVGYSKAERDFIGEVGLMAYNRTMMQMMRKAGMADIRKGKNNE